MRRGIVLVLESSNHERISSLANIDLDDYHELNRLVKGSLGMCPLPPSIKQLGFLAYCDDDALIRSDKPAPNGWAPHLGHVHLRGPVVIVRAEGELEVGLDEADLNFWAQYLLGEPSKEAQELALRDALFWEQHPSGVVIENIQSVDDFFRKLGIDR